MCDCYCANCCVCGKDLPIHLGDYVTPRQDIDVFCDEHIPHYNCRVFIIEEDEDGSFKKGYRIGIRALTDKAKEFKEYNYPNVEEFRFADV
jgi:hypothetical protein